MTTKETERLAVVETKVDTIIEEIRGIKKELTDMQKSFASKWVERVMTAFIAMILTAFIGGVIVIVFNKPEVATIPTTRTTTVTVNTNGTTTTKTTDATGHTTTDTRPSTSNEKPGTTTVTEESTNQPKQKSLLDSLSDLINGIKEKI